MKDGRDAMQRKRYKWTKQQDASEAVRVLWKVQVRNRQAITEDVVQDANRMRAKMVLSKVPLALLIFVPLITKSLSQEVEPSHEPLFCGCTSASKFCSSSDICDADVVAAKFRDGLNVAKSIMKILRILPADEVRQDLRFELCQELATMGNATDILLDFAVSSFYNRRTIFLSYHLRGGV